MDEFDRTLSRPCPAPVVLNLYTYLTLLSNKIARFTPNTLNGDRLLKIRN